MSCICISLSGDGNLLRALNNKVTKPHQKNTVQTSPELFLRRISAHVCSHDSMRAPDFSFFGPTNTTNNLRYLPSGRLFLFSVPICGGCQMELNIGDYISREGGRMTYARAGRITVNRGIVMTVRELCSYCNPYLMQYYCTP
jgi:hypothetical protein